MCTLVAAHTLPPCLTNGVHVKYRLQISETALLCALLALLGLSVFGPALAQPTHAHAFADQRLWLGIPGALDVVSNLPFALWGCCRIAGPDARTGAGHSERAAEHGDAVFCGPGRDGGGLMLVPLAPRRCRDHLRPQLQASCRSLRCMAGNFSPPSGPWCEAQSHPALGQEIAARQGAGTGVNNRSERGVTA
ncbi:hypothetical protein BH11PSE7_BH11PSE7_20800 [soil metagenome]